MSTALKDAAHSAVQQIQKADKRGLKTLYDRVGPTAFAVAVRILKDSSEAEEVVQEAFLEVWRRGAQYQERGSALAWVLQIVRSRAIDRLRTKRSQLRTVDAAAREPVLTPAVESLDARAERDKLVAALQTLPPEQLKAIELSYFQGLSHEEIALEMGDPLGTTKSRIRAAVLKLRDLFVNARGKP